MKIGVISKNNDLFNVLNQHNILKKADFISIEPDNVNSNCDLYLSYNISSKEVRKLSNLIEIKNPICIRNLFKLIEKHIDKEDIFNFKHVVINFSKNYAVINNQNINLTEKESEILKYLSVDSERAVSSSDLLSKIWGYSKDIESHTLQTHIYRIRQKLGDIIEQTDNGYRLNISY